jgi:hypothetical protein
MTRELLALILILPAIVVPTALTWWVCHKFVPPSPRPWVRWVYSAVVLAFSLRFVGGPIAASATMGDCLCVHCGRSARVVSCLGLEVLGQAEADRGVGPSPDAYERVFFEDEQGKHSHDWMLVSCFSRGAYLPFIHMRVAMCCTLIESGSWFRDLPKLHDRELARAYATRLAAAPPRERLDALSTYDSAAMDHEMPEVTFATWRERWRGDHQDWP